MDHWRKSDVREGTDVTSRTELMELRTQRSVWRRSSGTMTSRSPVEHVSSVWHLSNSPTRKSAELWSRDIKPESFGCNSCAPPCKNQRCIRTWRQHYAEGDVFLGVQSAEKLRWFFSQINFQCSTSQKVKTICPAKKAQEVIWEKWTGIKPRLFRPQPMISGDTFKKWLLTHASRPIWFSWNRFGPKLRGNFQKKRSVKFCWC